jgi:glutathione reductase (NADPH)
VPGLDSAPSDESIPFEWNALKTKRDAYIHRLNGIYEKNLEKDGVDYYEGYARFTSKNAVEVERADGSKYALKAKRIVIAVGGQPTWPKIEGAEHGITSDGFFELETQPKRVAVIGAGYIAVEVSLVARSSPLVHADLALLYHDQLAGIFHT